MRTALVQSVAGSLLVLGAVTALRRFSCAHSSDVGTLARFVDGFTRAVEQSGAVDHVRHIAGIYALDRLADADEEERALLLRCCVSMSAAVASQLEERRRQSAHSAGNASKTKIVDVTGSYLAKQGLAGMDLRNFIFDRCDLREIDLRKAELTGCSFLGADLARAHVDDRNILTAELRERAKEQLGAWRILPKGEKKMSSTMPTVSLIPLG